MSSFFVELTNRMQALQKLRVTAFSKEPELVSPKKVVLVSSAKSKSGEKSESTSPKKRGTSPRAQSAKKARAAE